MNIVHKLKNWRICTTCITKNQSIKQNNQSHFQAKIKVKKTLNNNKEKLKCALTNNDQSKNKGTNIQKIMIQYFQFPKPLLLLHTLSYHTHTHTENTKHPNKHTNKSQDSGRHSELSQYLYYYSHETVRCDDVKHNNDEQQHRDA